MPLEAQRRRRGPWREKWNPVAEQQLLGKGSARVYAVAPERTVVEVQRFRAWLSRSGRRMAIIGAAGIGALLVARGVIGLLT